MAILLDTAAVVRMIEARLESSVDGATVQVLHMGEPQPEGPSTVFVRVLGIELSRRPRRSTEHQDTADISVSLEVSCPEAVTAQSQLALASAVAAVVNGLDHATLTEDGGGGPPLVTEIHLGPVSEAHIADAPGGVHRLLGADVTVPGVATRRSGSTLEAHP